MKMFFVNVMSDAFVAHTIEIERDDLQEYYKILGVDCIDIVVRVVNGVAFDIICDDAGLFHEPVRVSAIDANGNPMLVGNLLFAHHDSNGNLTGITDDEASLIRNSIVGVFGDDDNIHPVVINCKYA